jgi:phospholipase/carboxylesterase
VLLRAMVPLSQPPAADLAGTPVLILSGMADPIVPAGNAARLAAMMSNAGAELTHRTLRAGHQLSQTDMRLAHDWLATLEQRAAA